MREMHHTFDYELPAGRKFYVKNTVTGKGFDVFSNARLNELRETLNDDYVFYVSVSADEGYSKNKEIRAYAKANDIDVSDLGL